MKKISLLYILVFFSTYLFGQETIIEEEELTEVVKPSQDSNVPFKVVDEVPIFPGCEESDRKEMRKCFQEMMQQHIAKHFRYPEEAFQKKIHGRVNLMFTINADGNVGNIRTRGPHPLLEKEAERIISLLPPIVPGKIKGKAVRVPFSVPITFGLTKTSKAEAPTEQPLIPIDSLDIEPKFLDYSFLNPEKTRRQKKRAILNSETEMKLCIQRHISNNFRYPEIAQNKNMQGRANVEFIISEEGNLSLKRVKGEHNILNNEARRIVSLFPKKAVPGKKNGNAVSTIIKFPINFKLQ